MLVIRNDQMDRFREAAQHRFEDEMLVHLRAFSPAPCKALGEVQMRKAIHFGVGQAFNAGFTSRGPVRLYLELMLLFGSRFGSDPQYPWATEILAEPDEVLQMQRAETLYAKAMAYRQAAVGPQDVYAFTALRNIAAHIRHPLPGAYASLEHFMAAMRQDIRRLYPQKADYVGREGLEALIRAGIGAAQRQQLYTVPGVTLVTLLMLAFGHACGSDLLYPWIIHTLNDASIADPAAKAARLGGEAQGWIDYLLADKG